MPRNANQSKSSNYSLDFDGSQYIDTNYYLPAGTKPKSISYWFKNTDPNGWSTTGYNYTIHGGALSTGAGFGMGALGSSFGSYLWFIGHSTGDYFIPSSATGVMTTNVWYHIVVTYDNSRTNNLHFYLDGVKIDETNETLNTSTANSVKIGASATGGGNSGGRFMEITDVCFFDYALSESQVTTLWGGGTSVSNPMALPSPPIAYYPLGGSAGAFQTPANNNDKWLIENNAIGDYVFDFDGTVNDCIIVPSSTTLEPQNLTVSAWVNWKTGSSPYSYPISKYYNTNESSYGITRANGPRFYITTSVGDIASPIATSVNLIDTGWHHLVGTYDGSYIRFYVNGEEIGNGTPATGSILYNSGDLIIGAFNGSGIYAPNGEQSNIQIWDSALSSSQVETLYNYGSPIRTLANIPQNSNLKAWYKLDASEIYNSSSTEWEVENNANPSVYTQSTKLNGNSGSRIFLNPNTGGSTGGITLPNSFSFSFWINTTSTLNGYASSGSVIEGSGGSTSSGGAMWNMFRYSHFNNGKWVIRLNSNFQGGTNGNVEVTSVINDGRWHHVLLTYDSPSTTLTVHTDNIQTYTLSTNNFGIGINVARIGTSYDGNTNSVFNGDLSNLSFWTDVLTSSQRNEIYNNGTPKDLSTNSNYSNLLNWYKLNNDLQDSKGSNNGTGGSTTTKTFGFINTLAGDSSGMSQSNLVQSDLQTVAPYSKYAMSFDGTDYINLGSGITLADSWSVSIWINTTTTLNNKGILSNGNPGSYDFFTFGPKTKNGKLETYLGNSYVFITPVINDGNWHHLTFAYDHSSTTIKVYTDNSESYSSTSYDNGTSRVLKNIGRAYSGWYWDGKLSNCSVWNGALTSAQVTEIYNQGLPGDLNSHSAYSNLVSWWQLGENSSYVGGAPNPWTFADEKGANNGLSPNLPETALINGVGTTANGVSSGMSEGSLVGDAPYSTANAISSGMAVQAFDSANPPNVISGRSEDIPS